MKMALKKPVSGKRWIPDKEDIEIENEIVCAPTMLGSDLYAYGLYSMSTESRNRMKKGLVPHSDKDKGWVPQTVK